MKKYFFALVPFLLFACTEETCDDGILNQDEDQVDCGGICNPCPTCSDGILNQDETDIDCGGVCGPCDVQYDSISTYGLNILYGSDSLNLTNDSYSFQANVSDGGSLTIKLYAVVGGWGYSMPQNWTVSPFVSSPQIFEVVNPGNAICELNFAQSNPNTVVVVQYLENGTSVTKQKVIHLN